MVHWIKRLELMIFCVPLAVLHAAAALRALAADHAGFGEPRALALVPFQLLLAAVFRPPPPPHPPPLGG